MYARGQFQPFDCLWPSRGFLENYQREIVVSPRIALESGHVCDYPFSESLCGNPAELLAERFEPFDAVEFACGVLSFGKAIGVGNKRFATA
jgi:hypothetical protein